MNKEQKKIAKKLFNMVYNWGRYGVYTDENDFAYINTVGQLLGNKSNGFCKRGKTTSECFIEKCTRKHLPF